MCCFMERENGYQEKRSYFGRPLQGHSMFAELWVSEWLHCAQHFALVLLLHILEKHTALKSILSQLTSAPFFHQIPETGLYQMLRLCLWISQGQVCPLPTEVSRLLNNYANVYTGGKNSLLTDTKQNQSSVWFLPILCNGSPSFRIFHTHVAVASGKFLMFQQTATHPCSCKNPH